MQELTYTQLKEILPSAKSFLEHAHEDLHDIGNRYFMLGCRLWEAQRYHYVEALGYVSIEQLSEKEFDLGRSSTYNLINIFERFCARGEMGQRKAWIDPKYKNYKYSQLIEMEKAYCLRINNIEKQIPPGTPVRVLKEYIKYVNKNPGHNKDLPDWEAEQKQVSVLPTAPIEGQLSITDTVPNETQPNTDVNNVAPTVEQPAETVQTFGQPTCAEPEQTETVAKPKANKPTYNFHSRDGVRAFLKDYKNWQPYFGFIGSFFKDMFFYSLKNGVNIYACGIDTLWGNGESLETKIDEIIYFINDDKRKSKKITKEQFERYCAEHKDEL